jgi:DNA mismatch endonuclease (patch repair protein)
MDRFSPAERSRLMGRVRGRDTSPEQAVRRLLHALGYRFRLHGSGVLGRPDVVWHTKKTAIFVHGCFWHQHRSCRRATVPQANHEFWAKKLSGNRSRDARVVRTLRSTGWRVLVLWQCQVHDSERLRSMLERFLGRATRSRGAKK